MLTLAFYPVDTWFFRESRPMESLGGTSLGNQFPPPLPTLMGAIRTRLGDMLGAEWHNLDAQPLPAWWGNADCWGDLTLSGPWLRLANKDYLPAPAHLLRSQNVETDKHHYVLLTPGEAVRCDLGQVRLPMLPSGTAPGVKPLDDHWLPREALSRLLTGQSLPHNLEPLSLHDLFVDEYRLGIGMDMKQRSVLDGQLYQTRHLRPHPDKDVAVLVNLAGLPAEQETALKQSLAANPLLRLGGEGRMAEVRIVTAPDHKLVSAAPPKRAKLLAVTLSQLPLEAGQWPLPGFIRQRRDDGQDVWQGELAGYSLTLLTMACGKARRQGGWDLKRHQPRAVQNQLPAGTVFFFDESPLPRELDALQLTSGGQQVPLALGWWQDPLIASNKD